MEVCNENHNEICYEPENKYAGCPLCESNERISELEDELETAREEMEEHECKT